MISKYFLLLFYKLKSKSNNQMTMKDITYSQIIDFLINDTTVGCEVPVSTEEKVTINNTTWTIKNRETNRATKWK